MAKFKVGDKLVYRYGTSVEYEVLAVSRATSAQGDWEMYILKGSNGTFVAFTDGYDKMYERVEDKECQ